MFFTCMKSFPCHIVLHIRQYTKHMLFMWCNIAWPRDWLGVVLNKLSNFGWYHDFAANTCIWWQVFIQVLLVIWVDTEIGWHRTHETYSKGAKCWHDSHNLLAVPSAISALLEYNGISVFNLSNRCNFYPYILRKITSLAR